MSKIEEALRRARNDRDDAAEQPARPSRPAVTRGRRLRQTKELVGLSAAEEIAHMREPSVRSHADLAARRIIDKDAVDSRVADAFRHLRTTIFQRAGRENFSLMVTAAGDQGGSSFVALNLAAAIAFEEGRTALVVDCNLRDPHLEQLVDADDAPGLTDYLAGEEGDVDKILHPVGIPRLRVVPAGRQPRGAMEYFTAPKLAQLINELKQRYRERTIILDAPAITSAADARILAEICDHSLLVVPYGGVTQTQVADAAVAIGEDKLIGCVLNNELRLPYLGAKQAKAS